MKCNGKFYQDNRKNINESAFALRICGKKSQPILELMNDFAIIKAEQAKLALEYIPLIKKHGKHTEREIIYNKMRKLNQDKSVYYKDYSRITNSYISGIFDAEGNVHINLIKTNKSYVKITQKSDPELLVKIKDFIGFGNINSKENYRLRFYKDNIIKFYQIVKPYIKIKNSVYDILLNQFVMNSTSVDIHSLNNSLEKLTVSQV